MNSKSIFNLPQHKIPIKTSEAINIYKLIKYKSHKWEWADLLGRTLSKDIILRFYHSMPESIKSSMFMARIITPPPVPLAAVVQPA